MKTALVWIVTGVIVGIFLAPTAGATTRKKLMRGLGDLRDSAEAEAAELIEENIQSLHEQTA